MLSLIGKKTYKTSCRAMLVRLLLSSLLLSLITLPLMIQADIKADMIWVQKSKRLLHLIDDSRIVATYPIALGANPRGHKQREGDSRTPEGLYFIDWHNVNSKFFLSLRISYPSQSDQIRAMQKGVDPGRYIMIHGQPNTSESGASHKAPLNHDWTDGCIALNNQNMLAIWNKVDDGIPILIEP